MEILKAIILGFVQGATEFLPVSSSGHLVLLSKLGWGEDGNSLFFNIMLHMGTLIAVCFVYRKKIMELVKNPTSKSAQYIIIASFPTVIIVGLLKFFAEDILTGKWLALGFAVTTVMLVVSELFNGGNKKINPKNAFVTGLVQGIAALPGISRSGSTISVQLMMGVDRKEAGDFSFLLSIPIILGSAIVECFGMSKADFVDLNILALILGVATAFLVGLVAIKLFLKVIRKAKFYPFAIYTGILTIVSLILL